MNIFFYYDKMQCLLIVSQFTEKLLLFSLCLFVHISFSIFIFFYFDFVRMVVKCWGGYLCSAFQGITAKQATYYYLKRYPTVCSLIRRFYARISWIHDFSFFCVVYLIPRVSSSFFPIFLIVINVFIIAVHRLIYAFDVLMKTIYERFPRIFIDSDECTSSPHRCSLLSEMASKDNRYECIMRRMWEIHHAYRAPHIYQYEFTYSVKFIVIAREIIESKRALQPQIPHKYHVVCAKIKTKWLNYGSLHTRHVILFVKNGPLSPGIGTLSPFVMKSSAW